MSTSALAAVGGQGVAGMAGEGSPACETGLLLPQKTMGGLPGYEPCRHELYVHAGLEFKNYGGG